MIEFDNHTTNLFLFRSNLKRETKFKLVNSKVHREHNKTLTEENKDIKNSGLNRVLKMQEQIQRAKESLNIEDNIEIIKI